MIRLEIEFQPAPAEWAGERVGIIAAGVSRAHATKVKNAAISDSEGAIFSYRTGTLPDFLEALLQQPGEPQDKQALAQLALGRKLTLYDRSLDMHVSNLRKKLGPHPDGRPRIVALRSRGYYYAP